MFRLFNVRPSGRFVVIAVITVVAVVIFSIGGETDLADDNNQVSDRSAAKVSERRPTPENFEIIAQGGDIPQEETQEDVEPAIDKTIRVKYDKSPDLPDGIAFASTLMLLQAVNENEMIAREWIVQEMGFGYEEAEEFRIRLLVINDRLADETARLFEETVCFQGVPKVYGDDVFIALEKVVDTRDSVAEDLYLQLASELSQSDAQQLRKWVDTNKLTTISTSHDQKERFKKHDVNGDAYAAKICLKAMIRKGEK